MSFVTLNKACIENIFRIFEFLKSFLRVNDEEFFLILTSVLQMSTD